MTRAQDLTGQKWNRLTAVRRGTKGRQHWVFRCDCGAVKEQKAPAVKRGDIKSCGCLSIDSLLARNVVHGMSDHPLYKAWAAMRARCVDHPDYGDRGIRVCERWNNFANFVEDMGERPEGKTLDRIDVNGDYEPSNCRWATRREQAENTTRNAYLELNGERMTVSQWARRLGISQKTLNRRRASGWTDAEVLQTPLGARRCC